MTKLMDEAIDTLRRVPTENQDEIARVVMGLTSTAWPMYRLTPEEEADLNAADAEIARGELASDPDVRTLWAKHSL